MNNTEVRGLVVGAGVGLALGLVQDIFKEGIIVPFINLGPRPDRFLGDPEVPIEIAGKRIHCRLDSGNASEMMLLKKTADYLQIKQKFSPHERTYIISVTVLGSSSITVLAPVMLAEDVNPRLDNDILPAWLSLKDFAISFYPHHAEFIPYPIIKPWAVSVPRVKEMRNSIQQGFHLL